CLPQTGLVYARSPIYDSASLIQQVSGRKALDRELYENIRFAVVAHCDGKGEARFLHILSYVFRGIIVVDSYDGQPFVLQFAIEFLEKWKLLPARRTRQIPKVDQYRLLVAPYAGER